MGIYLTSGACVYKAGANVSTSIPEDAWNTWMSGAEAIINVLCRNNYSDTYSTLNEDVKYILHDIGSSLVAIDAIKYDMSGYTSRVEAEDLINILRDNVLRGMSIIRDKKTQDFIDGA